MQNTVPYHIDKNIESLFYHQLELFSNLTAEKGKVELQEIISLSLKSNGIQNENAEKSALLELLLLGVLWNCHIVNAMCSNSKAIKELKYLSTENIPEKLKEVYYSLKYDTLVHHNLMIDNSQFKPSVTILNKLAEWLDATEEYKYELPVIHKWISIFEKLSDERVSADMYKIIRFASHFTDSANKTFGYIINGEFFTRHKKRIEVTREDYFQVTKSAPEYFLNFVSAVWMNEMHDKSFNSNKKTILMAPGCMRANNGAYCNAKPEGSYLKCTRCNTACNVAKLAAITESEDTKVMIAIHQSSFTSNTDQLKHKAVVGIACAGCLTSGGLMLLNNNIRAKCLILNAPGCNQHWTDIGFSTTISEKQLNQIVPVQEPKVYSLSDS
ncbi:MAG: DUF116 domain-containing protein [Bacteroidales bacterium]|nr:DUF116 domain-containing protein [Bacteroidales bacterium]MBN2818191.1 DUF116 domain-containing protein [Bacteroidales bacterium]